MLSSALQPFAKTPQGEAALLIYRLDCGRKQSFLTLSDCLCTEGVAHWADKGCHTVSLMSACVHVCVGSCLDSHLFEEGTMFCVFCAAFSTVFWMSVTAFICVRVSTAIGHLTGKRIVYASFTEFWFPAVGFNLHLFVQSELLVLLCKSSVYCFAFLFTVSLLLCRRHVILGFGCASCCSVIAPLNAREHRTEERRRKGTSDSQTHPFPLVLSTPQIKDMWSLDKPFWLFLIL